METFKPFTRIEVTRLNGFAKTIDTADARTAVRNARNEYRTIAREAEVPNERYDASRRAQALSDALEILNDLARHSHASATEAHACRDCDAWERYIAKAGA